MFDAATDALARELRRALADAYDAGLDEHPLELLSVINQGIIAILKNIENPDYRQYVGELLAEKIPELLRAAEPGYRRHTLH
jgi:hypothetical protein